MIRRKQFLVSILAGVVIGGGLLTKSSALFYLYLLPFSLILFDLKEKDRVKKFIKWVALAVVTSLIAYGMSSILKLSSNYFRIALKNNTFTLTVSQWIKNPFVYASANFHILLGFIVSFSTIPFLILVVLALVIDKKFIREKLLLLAWTIVPLMALMFFGTRLYPRYILFMMMPLLVLCAYGIVTFVGKIKPHYLGIGIVVLMAVPMIYVDCCMLSDFANSPVPSIEHWQYTNSFYSGGGTNQIVKILEQKSENHKIYVGTQGPIGLLPDALTVYLYNDKNIDFQQLVVVPAIPSELVKDAKLAPTYFVFSNPPSNEPAGVTLKNWPVKQIYGHRRQDGSYLVLDQVTSQ